MRHLVKFLFSLAWLSLVAPNASAVPGPALIAAMKEGPGWTELHKAAKSGDMITVGALIRLRTTNVNAKTPAGLTPLHIAAYYNQTQVIDQLFKDVRLNFMESSGPVRIGEMEYTAHALAAMHESAQEPGSALKKIRSNPRCVVGGARAIAPVYAH